MKIKTLKLLGPVLLLGLLFLSACSSDNKLSPRGGTPKNSNPVNNIACTAEAKLCPDGSAVGRTGSNCEFAPCPTSSEVSPTSSPSSRLNCKITADCPLGYQCIQSCGPPVARVGDPEPAWFCESDEVANKPRNCPICLASNSKISTPSGEINVKDIAIGMKVWSLNSQGQKVVSTVIAAVQTPTPKDHMVIHLVLADQREVWASFNHPIANGSPIGTLKIGNFYDGSKVIKSQLISYWDTATYDILPDSGTGYYWANGILLGSTLKP